MSENTKIQWATHTFNGWEGCAKVSDGCKNCYAETRANRFGQVQWGKGQPRRRTSAANWRLPLKWQRAAEDFGDGTRPRVFSASLSDWLDDEVPIAWLADLLRLVYDTPALDWLLLTKRPENFFKRMESVWRMRFFEEFDRWLELWAMKLTPPDNVWLGVSAEDQPRADIRARQLAALPARVKFLSCEPLLGPVVMPDCFALPDFAEDDPRHTRRWCIIGGESGPGARPCDTAWIRALVAQCRATGVAPFVKQLGANSKAHGFDNHHADKKGGDIVEWPADLQVREFP